MDWAGWAVLGFIGTIVLTGVMVFAQLVGWTRMDIPLLLGTMFTASVDRARIVGVVAHLIAGQFFALLYALGFWQLGRSGPIVGGIFGLVHGLAALTVIIPLLPGIHPRMASERSGPEMDAVLEPPGLFALNFGAPTFLVTLVAHVLFGITLGLLIEPR